MLGQTKLAGLPLEAKMCWLPPRKASGTAFSQSFLGKGKGASACTSPFQNHTQPKGWQQNA